MTYVQIFISSGYRKVNNYMESNNKRRLKFEELAEKRVNDLIKKMKLLGNLSNRSNYDYTDEHVKQILSVVREEFKELERKFTTTQAGRERFTFR